MAEEDGQLCLPFYKGRVMYGALYKKLQSIWGKKTTKYPHPFSATKPIRTPPSLPKNVIKDAS